MSEPTNAQKAQVLAIWSAAYQNLADNMRERGLWSITSENLELIVAEMDAKVQSLLDDSES